MIKIWMDFAFASARLCHEAQEVMSLRLTKLAQGGTRSRTEAQLMVTEKGFALAEAFVTLAAGGSMLRCCDVIEGMYAPTSADFRAPSVRLKHPRMRRWPYVVPLLTPDVSGNRGTSRAILLLCSKRPMGEWCAC
jgi:hypothetical protein